MRNSTRLAVAAVICQPFSSALVAQGLNADLGRMAAISGALAVGSVGVVPATSAPGRKSPALAGALSWLVFPGVGSYYAGNSKHWDAPRFDRVGFDCRHRSRGSDRGQRLRFA